MSETIRATRPSDTSKPRRRGRTLAWVGAGTALAIAAAAFVVPQLVHAQRVGEYTDLVAQHDQALIEQARAQAALDAATALTIAERGEVEQLGERLLAVGKTAEPILTAEQTQKLTEAGNAVIAIVGEPVDADGEPVGADGDDAPASEPLGEVTPTKTLTVADEDVTVELIEATAAQLASTLEEVARVEGLISAEEARMDEFRTVIAGAVPVLRAAAETTAAQVTQVVNAAPKAPDASATAVAAAQKVQEVAETDDAIQLLAGLEAYVEVSLAAQAQHAAVVEQEAAAAQAEAARKAAANRGGGDGERKKSRLCSRFRPSPGGGGSLVLVYC